MSRNDEIKALLERTQFQLSARLRILLLIFIIAGLLAFIIGIISDDATLAWQSLLINAIFFGGLSFGGLTFSVIFTITNANWGRPIKRMAEAMTGFVPVAAVLFLVLFLGADHFFQWVDPTKVIHSKAGWLNYPFFVIRNIFLFTLFSILIWFYLKASLRPDIALANKLVGFSNSFADRFIKNYGDQEKEEEQAFQRAKLLAPYLGLLFAIVCTIIAFDWIMSIDQEWFSTLFGVQYAVANLVAAAAVLIIVSGVARQKFKLEEYITIKRHHDIGKLTFAGCLLWTYMIFSQVLVIWYGNMPEETPFLILRMQSMEWGFMFWFIMMLLFIIPFFGLVSRTACNSVWFSRLIAGEILLGVWLEKYFLIVPSIQENRVDTGTAGLQDGLPGFAINLYDILITLGVLAAFLLCFLWVLQKVPTVPISDRYFVKQGEQIGV